MKGPFRLPKEVTLAIAILALMALSCQALMGGTPAPESNLASTLSASTPANANLPTQPVAASTQPAATQPVVDFLTPTHSVYVAPDQSGLNLGCDGARTDVPCEPRKIRIRGFSNPTCDGGTPQVGQSYGWFAHEGTPWIKVTHGLPGEPGIPKGWAKDSGTLLEFVKSEGGYWYVGSDDYPGYYWTLDQSEVSCASRPSADHFMKPITTKWCPVNPTDGTSTMITLGETYVWFGLGYHVQFNFVERYPDAANMAANGVEPDIVANGGEFIPIQDFEPAKLINTTANRHVWLQLANGETVYAPNSYCNYWPDTAP